MLASRQPMVEDLRVIISALRTASIIERIGDYAKNIAKRSITISQSTPIGPTKTIGRMGGQVQSMIKNVLDAYVTRDAAKAEYVRSNDGEIDALHTSLFSELMTYMMEDPSHITACTHLMFISKNIERIVDHALNIAENVYFLVHGNTPIEDRTKKDQSCFIVVGTEAETKFKESR
jgi:phosphate transport system protein